LKAVLQAFRIIVACTGLKGGNGKKEYWKFKRHDIDIGGKQSTGKDQ
jgi:hypothetical protein